jgi:hypothetical protein
MRGSTVYTHKTVSFYLKFSMVTELLGMHSEQSTCLRSKMLPGNCKVRLTAALPRASDRGF